MVDESDDSIPANITPPIYVTPRVLRNSPLSTKREKQKSTPLFRRPAPKVAKTAPPMRSLHSQFQIRQPRIITPSGATEPLHSPIYNKEKHLTYFEQCFKISSIIGKGSFGEVFAVKSMEDSRNYAIKVSIQVIRQNCASKYREVENHMRLPKHSNLVEFVKAWEEGGRLYIQQELCEKSLLQLCMERHALPEEMIWNILIDLLKAVDHLHMNDMIHDDIKPDNIFLTSKGVCKLGDFGLVINLKNKNDVASAEEGDSKYLAPEVLNGAPSKASDIFSLGVTILEAATDLDIPSNGESWHQIRNGEIPDRFFVGISVELRFIIQWMLSSTPSIRPTTKELLKQNGIRRRIWKRTLYVKSVELAHSIADWSFVITTWLMALFSVVVYPALSAICDRRASICAETVSKQHTPIQTPETSSSRLGFAKTLAASNITPFDYSDEENVSFQRRLFPLIPRFQMDDDEDDEDEDTRNDNELPTSSSNSSTIDSFTTSSPILRESPIRRSLRFRSETPPSARRIRENNHRGSGDYNSQQRRKYERMRRIEACMDSDDNDELINAAAAENIMPQSCPPLLRSCRKLNLQRAPKLNFNLLDNNENTGNDKIEIHHQRPNRNAKATSSNSSSSSVLGQTRTLRSTAARRGALIAEDSSADEF
ncbi:unnamed protein product [Caenorhabditis angaria]|uniref:Membrane-associated tyrosine- and threonine-specific cdc2-inhibitory kinase wee-1.3 n=1 Tax=Caenorhabditis angaria TaxID=860376 RepID=A0A9P1N274_9PELO|nr:unnamed protein product [Caenorhabditis angaria]